MHLHSQRQGKLRWDEDLAAFVPDTVVPNQQTVGSGRGSFDLDDCLAEGISAGAAAAIAAGFELRQSEPAPFGEPKASGPTRQLWLVPGQTGGPDDWHHHFVDFQRDQSVADVLRSTGAGMRSRGARQALHLHQHRQRPGQDLRRQRDRRDRRRAPDRRRGVPRHRRHRHHHLPGAVHAGGLRGPGRTRSAASSSTPPA